MDCFSSVGVTRKSSRKRHKKKRMKKSMSKIKDILRSISVGMLDLNQSTKKGRTLAISEVEALFTRLSSEIDLLTNEFEEASSGSSDDAVSNNHVKSELSSLLVSVLRQVANEKNPGTAYPSPASGYGGAALSTTQVAKNTKITQWKGEKVEPWENVCMRVLTYAEMNGCLDVLVKDPTKDWDTTLNDDEKDIRMDQNRGAMGILKIVFGKEGKAFDIVNKHLKRSASKLGSISLKGTRDKDAVAWAFRVWDELNMQFEKGGISDRRGLLGTYRGCKMKKGANPVEYLIEMETI